MAPAPPERTPSRRTRSPGEEIVDFLRPYMIDFFNKLVEEGKIFSKLEKNQDDLVEEMGALIKYKDELEREIVSLERDGTKKRRHSAGDWIDRVNSLAQTVDDFNERFCKRTPCLASCSLGSFWTDYQLSKSVADYLNRVRKLDEEKKNFVDLQNMVIDAGSWDIPDSL